MRLIDKDAMIADLVTVDPQFKTMIDWCIRVLEAQPTIDAVPVIRCKDCKFHHDRTQCKKRIGAWFDDDYCNGAVRAERKEECSR